jgi:hypothetical protein
MSTKTKPSLGVEEPHDTREENSEHLSPATVAGMPGEIRRGSKAILRERKLRQDVPPTELQLEQLAKRSGELNMFVQRPRTKREAKRFLEQIARWMADEELPQARPRCLL